MYGYTMAAGAMFIAGLALNLKFNRQFKNMKLVVCSVAVVSVAQLLTDSLTVWRGFWVFDDGEIIGVRVPFIPVENLLFGLALFFFTVLFFDKFRGRAK